MPKRKKKSSFKPAQVTRVHPNDLLTKHHHHAREQVNTRLMLIVFASKKRNSLDNGRTFEDTTSE